MAAIVPRRCRVVGGRRISVGPVLVAYGPSGSTNALVDGGCTTSAPSQVRPMVAEGLRAERRGEWSRVVCEVDGDPLWFETRDGDLAPTWEAIGAALLLPALLQHRPLHLDGHVCGRWLGNSALLLRTVSGWWDVPQVAPGVRSVEPAPRPVGRTAAARRRRRTAQCFTCGVDSFHTAIRMRPPPEVLVTAIGYDVPLGEAARAADLERRVRAVGASLGREVVIIRSNLREHPSFGNVGWPLVHGGALAALGHLLGHRIGRLIIPASFATSNDKPWGSHWRIDHRWSSGRVTIGQFGERTSRLDRVDRIVGEPLALEHLLVCYQRSTPTGNCGRCPKCLSTMVMLAAAGARDACATFPPLPRADDVEAAAGWRHRASLDELMRRDGVPEDWRTMLRAIADDLGPAVRTPPVRRLADLLRMP
jgi:hypothetical protein